MLDRTKRGKVSQFISTPKPKTRGNNAEHKTCPRSLYTMRATFPACCGSLPQYQHFPPLIQHSSPVVHSHSLVLFLPHRSSAPSCINIFISIFTHHVASFFNLYERQLFTIIYLRGNQPTNHLITLLTVTQRVMQPLMFHTGLLVALRSNTHTRIKHTHSKIMLLRRNLAGIKALWCTDACRNPGDVVFNEINSTHILIDTVMQHYRAL